MVKKTKMEASRRISIPSTELSNILLAKTKLLTRSTTIVHNIGNWLCKVTIPNYKVSGIGEHRYDGGKTDR